jgi:hypothetical protein
MSDPTSESRRSKPRRGDVSAAIVAYLRENPDADYFEMLNDLHARGYRVNRHGNTELRSLWKSVREEARGNRRR